MENKTRWITGTILIATITGGLLGCPCSTDSNQARNFAMFTPGYEGCYDRKTMPSTFAVDAHNHFRPFGDEAIPFEEMLDYLRNTNVYFVNVFGIGQKLPPQSECSYYLDCPGTPVTPSLSNDFVNADNMAARLPNHLPKDIHLTLAMTFPDLANPEEIGAKMKLLDHEYPGMFSWMGEVNVVKQALFDNHHEAVTEKDIEGWRDFMAELKKRDMPVSFHSDLGDNDEPTKYLPLMEKILEEYGDRCTNKENSDDVDQCIKRDDHDEKGNIIIWHHMGLSKELTNFDPDQHISLMSRMLNANRNLYLDISWRVIYDNYFSKPETRQKYIYFLNKYHNRILPGTDFVASANKTLKIYKEEVAATSDILKDLDDLAFRNIALGGNYFKLMRLPYDAPKVCESPIISE